MHVYKIGELYHPNRKNWPELAQYNYRGGEHELVLFFNHPTNTEIHDLRQGEAELALYVERSLIILLYRFGRAIDWSDAPYSYHLVDAPERVLPPDVSDAQHTLLHIVLVDASNGVISAMRVIGMPPEFTQELHRAIREQATMPFRRDLYNGELEALYAGYSSEILAEMSSVHFTSQP